MLTPFPSQKLHVKRARYAVREQLSSVSFNDIVTFHGVVNDDRERVRPKPIIHDLSIYMCVRVCVSIENLAPFSTVATVSRTIAHTCLGTLEASVSRDQVFKQSAAIARDTIVPRHLSM